MVFYMGNLRQDEGKKEECIRIINVRTRSDSLTKMGAHLGSYYPCGFQKLGYQEQNSTKPKL